MRAIDSLPPQAPPIINEPQGQSGGRSSEIVPNGFFPYQRYGTIPGRPTEAKSLQLRYRLQTSWRIVRRNDCRSSIKSLCGLDSGPKILIVCYCKSSWRESNRSRTSEDLSSESIILQDRVSIILRLGLICYAQFVNPTSVIDCPEHRWNISRGSLRLQAKMESSPQQLRNARNIRLSELCMFVAIGALDIRTNIRLQSISNRIVLVLGVGLYLTALHRSSRSASFGIELPPLLTGHSA